MRRGVTALCHVLSSFEEGSVARCVDISAYCCSGYLAVGVIDMGIGPVHRTGFVQIRGSPGIRPESWKFMDMQIACVTDFLTIYLNH